MVTNEEMRKIIATAKTLQIAFLGSVLTYIIILEYIHFRPAFSNNSILTLLTAVLGFLAIIDLALAYFLPRRIIKQYKQKSQLKQGLLSAHTLCGALFESVAIYGLALGILGAGRQMTLPFFIVSAGALILSFPTEGKWKKMLE